MTKAIVLLIEAIQGGASVGFSPSSLRWPSGTEGKKFQVIAKGRKNVAGFDPNFSPIKLNISCVKTIKLTETRIFVPSR